MEAAGKTKQAITGFFSGGGLLVDLVRACIWIFLFIFIIESVRSIYLNYKKMKDGSPWLIKDSLSGKKSLQLIQKKTEEKGGDAIQQLTIKRSENEIYGAEFTYTFWMYINDWSYKYNQWKHVFHKGNMTSWPLRAPGVWLHPTRNAMRIYMNTYSKIGDWVQVENIPVKKWFHTAIVLKQRNLDVFINGDMVKSYKLFGLPKQNYGDLFIHRLSGYDGFTSRLRYFNYAISYSELDKLIKQGPSPIGCSASNDLPPYLASSWWTNNYNPTDFADT